jgi:hypothetical protein
MKLSLALGCLVCPSFSRSGGAEANSRVQGALGPEDSAWQEARRAYI